LANSSVARAPSEFIIAKLATSDLVHQVSGREINWNAHPLGELEAATGMREGRRWKDEGGIRRMEDRG
jgi:hypothetical protein